MIKSILRIFRFLFTTSNSKTHEFKLIIVPYLSGVAFKYLSPDGKWRYILKCEEDLFTYGINTTYSLQVCWYLLNLNKVGNKTKEEYYWHELEKWGTLEKVNAHHEKEAKEVAEKNNSNEKQRKEAQERLNNFWK